MDHYLVDISWLSQAIGGARIGNFDIKTTDLVPQYLPILVKVENSDYSIVASRNTCYYSGNQVFGGASNPYMLLNEKCFYSETSKICKI